MVTWTCPPAPVPAPAFGPDSRSASMPLDVGVENQEIARRLSISHRTARNHVSNIFTKLQVADRAQAIVAARDAGLGMDR